MFYYLFKFLARLFLPMLVKKAVEKNKKWQTKTKVGQQSDSEIHHKSKSLDPSAANESASKLDTESRIVLVLDASVENLENQRNRPCD
jgi:hypothetical protein